MQRRSYIRPLALAAAVAASMGVHFPTARPAAQVVKAKRHDPERLAAATTKRDRKNAKRLRESQ